MANTFFGLTIGSTGLFASKTGLNTTAHNVANIETKGYTKQTVSQVADNALRTRNKYGMLGTGVLVTDITQTRSQYYDEKYRSNNAESGKFSQRHYFMKEVEGYLNEIQLQGFTVSFDNMYNSLQELAKDPASLTVRTQVVNYAESMCEYFNSLFTNLQKIQDECNYEVKNQVQRINSLSDQIATLTKQINTVEVGGENANDLRDQRNLLIDELSEIVNVDVTEKHIGDAGLTTYVVRIDGNTIVDTYEVNKLNVKPREYKENQCDMDGLYDIYWTNGEMFKPTSASMSGNLKALFEVRDGNNKENLRGVSSVVLPEGTTQVVLKNTNINDVADLNIPTEGQIRIGNGDYEYSSFKVTEDANGNFEYVFDLTSEARRTYPVGTKIVLGSDIDYKGIPYYMAQINQFIRTFAQRFNEVHREGQNLYGNDENQFFTASNLVTGKDYNVSTFANTDTPDLTELISDSTLTDVPYYFMTAQNFKVSTALMDDPSLIATTYNLTQGVGGNKLIESLIALKKDTAMFKQGNPAQFLQTLVAEIGIDTKSAKDFAESQQNIVASVSNQRLSVSGVDRDEEAMSLVRYQEAYNLSSKVISVMQQIYDKLINETGI